MGFSSTVAAFAWGVLTSGANTAPTDPSSLAPLLKGTTRANLSTTGPSNISPSSTHAAPSFDAATELLLMDVVYDQLRVDQALSVLQDKAGHRYMPVRQFSASLGFRIQVSAEKRLAKGFLTSPKDSFEVDGLTGICRHGKTVVKFDPSLCFTRDGDMYLDSDLFAKFTGIHLLWQMNLLQLEVSSESPLNIEKQWVQRARDQLREATTTRLANYENVKIPYKLWSVPSIDAEIYSADQVGYQASDAASRLSISGAGDLLMMSAQYRIVSDSDGQPTATLSLGRSDPSAHLLGSMKARQVEFGDLYLPPEPLLARGRNGLGFQISNFPLSGQDLTNQHQIRGHGTPGALLELYNGDTLVDTTNCNQAGEYSFPTPLLNPGPNDLKIVHVDSGGIVTEENRRVYGDNSGPAEGESRYKLVAAKIGQSLYNSDIFANVQNQDSREVIAEAQKGLASGTWASALAAWTQGSQGTGEQVGLGIHTWSNGLLWHAQSMVGLTGGAALSGGVTKKIGTTSVTLEHTEAVGQLSQRILPEIGADANSLTEISLDGVGGHKNHQYSYAFSADKLEGINPSTIFRGRFTAGDSNFLVSNSFTTQFAQGQTNAAGFTQFRKNLGSTVGLFELGYGLSTGPPLQLARLSFNRSIAANYSVRYGLEYDQSRAQPMGVLGTLYRSLGPIDVGINLEMLQSGSVKANLLLTMGFQGEGPGGRMTLTRPGVGASGSVTARVFVDKHLTGIYEPDDPLVPDVGFLVDGHTRFARTTQKGTCTLEHLSPDQEVSMTLDEDTFVDPNWIAEKPGIKIAPRPGRTVRLDFPIVETAELDGNLEDKTALATHPGLTAQLVQGEKLVDTSILDTDGEYVFSRIRPGEYEIRLIDLGGSKIGVRKIKILPGANLKGILLPISK